MPANDEHYLCGRIKTWNIISHIFNLIIVLVGFYCEFAECFKIHRLVL